MKIIDQTYTIEHITPNALQLIEKMGRKAYKSEDKITETSANAFVKMIATKNHEAVLEFADMTVSFITDRGIGYEIVRHRLCSFIQESTRYVNYSKDKFGNELTFIRPMWVKSLDASYILEDPYTYNWYTSCQESEKAYLKLISDGSTPQMARQVLNNSIKTDIGVKTNFREWKHIFKLRAISKAAHPQMRDLMIPLYLEMREKFPEVFDLGEPE